MSTDYLNQVFSNLKLDAKCVELFSTNSSTFYNVELGNSCSLKKFSSQVKEIEFRLRSSRPLFLKVLPEKGLIQLQKVNSSLSTINFDSLYKRVPGILPVVLGLDYRDNLVHSDFSKHPHTLIAGTTGSGKSIALHNIICNSLKKKNTELYLSDAKTVEFSIYKNHPKVTTICNSYEENLSMLKSLVSMMEARFKILNMYKCSSHHEVFGMNTVLIVIDEISDLILQDKSNEFKNLLLKLSQKSRAAGMFIVAATQRPSVDVLTGTIKANFPARIALKTASSIDSKVILDQPGAELLEGKGDAIINNDKYQYLRFRFPFINPSSVLKNISVDR